MVLSIMEGKTVVLGVTSPQEAEGSLSGTKKKAASSGRDVTYELRCRALRKVRCNHNPEKNSW